MSSEPPSPAAGAESQAPRRRRWRAKFAEAFRGLRLGIRGHSSFLVHFPMAALVIATAAILQVDLIRWCILIGCIVAVIAAELFNSAIEILCRVLEIERLPNGRAPLDIAAGAVLAVAIGAAIIGCTIFAVRLIELISRANPTA